MSKEVRFYEGPGTAHLGARNVASGGAQAQGSLMDPEQLRGLGEGEGSGHKNNRRSLKSNARARRRRDQRQMVLEPRT